MISASPGYQYCHLLPSCQKNQEKSTEKVSSHKPIKSTEFAHQISTFTFLNNKDYHH